MEKQFAFILQFDDESTSLETVGGKGFSLARLSRAGFPVPAGFFLSTEAYRRFISANDLQLVLLKTLEATDVAHPESLEEASRQIAALFQAASIPPEIASELSLAYSTLGKPAVAVRSSATAEDLPGASFAGQQDTYLNIQGQEAVLEAVKCCWASLWTGRAIGYRIKNGIDQDSVSLAVVIQKLVPAEAAGVLFTANPVNGHRNEAMITASWGLGEAIVSGLVSPDTLVIEKTTRALVEQKIAEKQVMTVRKEAGVSEESVPPELRKKAVLNKLQANELLDLGIKIEILYGLPMDIEWVLAEGRFAILQARPITSLPEPPLVWKSPVDKLLLMRASFAEFVPNPVSPLFATLGVPIISRTSQKMFREYMPGLDVKNLAYYVVNQYVYLGFVGDFNFYWCIMVGLFSGAIQKMLKNSQVRWQAMQTKYHALVDGRKEIDLASLTSQELWQMTQDVFTGMAEYYNVAQSAPIPSAVSSEISFSRYYNTLIKRKGDPESSTFLLGLDTLALNTEKSLFNLAVWIREKPEVDKTFETLSTTDLKEALESEKDIKVEGWQELTSQFKQHQKQFGHTIYDLDFAKPIPADDPAPLIDALKGYLAGKGSDPYARQKALNEKRDRAVQAITQRLDPIRRKGFLRLLHWAQEWGPKREDCISDLGWGYPLLRQSFRELGRRLVSKDVLGQKEDIYWLEAKEIEDLVTKLDGHQELISATAQVVARQAIWQRVRQEVVPQALPEKSWLTFFLPRENKKGSFLKGVGASSGRITGPACILLDPQDFPKMKPGDIIVAVTTTPAWTPLFAMASGVVTEIGGPLSHSSIVAREFGIPAVLAVANATHHIRSGQQITVDGSAGKVFLNP